MDGGEAGGEVGFVLPYKHDATQLFAQKLHRTAGSWR